MLISYLVSLITSTQCPGIGHQGGLFDIGEWRRLLLHCRHVASLVIRAFDRVLAGWPQLMVADCRIPRGRLQAPATHPPFYTDNNIAILPPRLTAETFRLSRPLRALTAALSEQRVIVPGAAATTLQCDQVMDRL